MHFGKRFTLVSFIFSLFSLCSRITAIKIIGRNANVTAGDDAHLFCQLIDTMEDLTSITWQRRTKEKPTDTDFLIINSDGKVEYSGFGNRVEFTGNILKHNGSILLKNVTSSDEGIYTCILSIYPSGPFEREIHLAVLVLPVVSVGPDVPPVAGDAEQILATCTAADAKPEAEVSWSLEALSDSVKIQTDVTVDSEERYTVKSSLIGVASKDLNEQNVQCLVSHPGLQEKLELNCTLIIHYPPQVVYITSVGDQGETREFQCDADANPKPTNFTWSRFAEYLKNKIIPSETEQPSISGFLTAKDTQYNATHPQQKAITNSILTDLVIGCNIPLSVVENRYFRNFLSVSWSLSHTQTYSSHVVLC
ncbi:nectin-4-like isoform X2 [Neoarius graeffei]|uniref:nectin-4-like isoform X2 n=1 Tax=Neoarius graeffei TaxID=443677 RepID=UPI00298D4C48|nr:nectin-4-like isoform X2 [Neoarius graeffei]